MLASLLDLFHRHHSLSLSTNLGYNLDCQLKVSALTQYLDSQCGVVDITASADGTAVGIPPHDSIRSGSISSVPFAIVIHQVVS